MSTSVSGFVTMRVTGLRESVMALDAIQREMPHTRTEIIREGALFFFKDAQKNAHVITGKTKASIHVESVTAERGIISASFGMPFEEKRGGTRLDAGTPHKTFSVAAKNTGAEMPRIIKKNIDALLGRHKTR